MTSDFDNFNNEIDNQLKVLVEYVGKLFSVLSLTFVLTKLVFLQKTAWFESLTSLRKYLKS